MDVDASRGPLRYLHDVPDPRAANVSHPLPSLLAITLMAVICGEDDYQGVVEWADVREGWLTTFLDLPHGVPSPDTLERVFSRLDPNALEQAFIAFTRGVAERSEGRLVAIDGKTLRRSFDHGGRKAAIHMVNAWDHANGLVLGQFAVDDKSNEIGAVPALIELLDLKGCVVSLDAMHCQKQTAAAILEAKADYLLAVKQNQKSLHDDIKLFFDEAIDPPSAGDGEPMPGLLTLDTPTVDGDHGRLEVRRLWASHEVGWLKKQGHDWPGLRGLVCVEGERLDFATGRTAVTRRWFITSLDPRKAGAERLLEAVRGHWSIENQLHWSLDVTFREDDSRVRRKNAAQNLARIRRLAMNLVRHMPAGKTKTGRPRKISMRLKRKRCGWVVEELMQALCQPISERQGHMR
jgi:predicted transposase YbfD/YdcC